MTVETLQFTLMDRDGSLVFSKLARGDISRDKTVHPAIETCDRCACGECDNKIPNLIDIVNKASDQQIKVTDDDLGEGCDDIPYKPTLVASTLLPTCTGPEEGWNHTLSKISMKTSESNNICLTQFLGTVDANNDVHLLKQSLKKPAEPDEADDLRIIRQREVAGYTKENNQFLGVAEYVADNNAKYLGSSTVDEAEEEELPDIDPPTHWTHTGPKYSLKNDNIYLCRRSSRIANRKTKTLGEEMEYEMRVVDNAVQNVSPCARTTPYSKGKLSMKNVSP